MDDLAFRQDGWVQLRCVIVDDDETFVEVARDVLERDGVTVAGAASSCAEAVQRAEALRPAAAEQDQPATEPDEDQVKQPNRHG